MPLPQEFMERVVAWPGSNDPGYVNLHWTSPKGPGMRGKPFRDINEFMNMAQSAATKPQFYKEIYFCLSTQSQVGKAFNGNPTAARNAKMALKLKAIWLDVDVGKEGAYATLEEALKAIYTFQSGASLPEPSALVFSGGGVHVYWISEKPLTVAEWRPYAEGLKAEALRLGLRCDAGLTTDEARVLRVPGTFNYKTQPPRPVRLAHLGSSYNFERGFGRLAKLAPASPSGHGVGPVTAQELKPPFDLSAFMEGPAAVFAGLNAQADALSAGLHQHNDRPLNPDGVFKHCLHFQDAALTHGAHHSQGLWMKTVLASTWFEEGRTWARYFSKGYKTYTQEETDAMYDRKLNDRAERSLGWPSCETFEDDGAKCKLCPFYKKIRSPLNLAERVVVLGQAVKVAPPPPPELCFPAGYALDDKGFICQIVQKTTKEGETSDDLLPLFESRLRNFVAQAGDRQLLFEVELDNGRWGQASVKEIELTTDQSLMKALRRDGVKPCVDNEKRIRSFMTSFMARLDAEKARIVTAPFGWVYAENGGDLPIGFAYGGRLVLTGGGIQRSGYADRTVEAMYRPQGTAEPWYRAHKLITEQKHIPIEVIMAASLAAPLIACTGQYNGIVCPTSDLGGTHKSTGAHVGCAIWGSPKHTKERTNASQKGLLHKLGQIKNLPVYVDEINSNERMDKVREMLGEATEGGTGSKLRQDRSFFEQDEWQTLMIICANVSMIDNILANTKSTDSQLQRVFEFDVDRRPDSANPSEVSRLINSLDRNYGHVGLAYSEVLGRDPQGIKDFVAAISAKFDAEVQHTSPGRFRQAMAVAIFAGASLGNKYLGCSFNLTEMWDFLKAQYIAQRSMIARAVIVAGTPANTANALNQFFKSCVRNAIWVDAMPAGPGKPAVTFLGGVTQDRAAPIHVRFAVQDATIDISRANLEKFLIDHKHAAGSVINGLFQHFNAAELRKINLSSGSKVLGGRETIIRIPVPLDSPFLSSLHTHTTADKRPPNAYEDDGIETPAGLSAGAQQAAFDLKVVKQAFSNGSGEPEAS